MTPAALHTELLSGPLAAECAPFVAVAQDGAVAAILNRKDRTGYIPARHFSVALAKFPVTDAFVHWVTVHGTIPAEFGGGVPSFALYTLLRNLDRVDKSVDKGDLRASVADVTAGLAAASQAGLVGDNKPIPGEFGPFLLSGEVKISRVEEIDGIGASVTAEQVGAAR